MQSHMYTCICTCTGLAPAPAPEHAPAPAHSTLNTHIHESSLSQRLVVRNQGRQKAICRHEKEQPQINCTDSTCMP